MDNDTKIIKINKVNLEHMNSKQNAPNVNNTKLCIHENTSI